MKPLPLGLQTPKKQPKPGNGYPAPLAIRYNQIVEGNQCAKAHFFIARKAMHSNRESIEARVAEIVEQVGTPGHIEPVEVQLLGGGKARLLRIYIDKPEGVTHADCEFITHEVGTILDTEDVIPGGTYTLEVSSPGVERKLSKPSDFQRFVGQKAKVVLREPVQNQKRWEGTLASFADNVVTLQPAAGEPVEIPLEKVEKANLKFEW